MSTTATPDRFTTLPDENILQATVVALEEHGFSVEVVGDLDAANKAVLARIPEGSSVMTNTSVTLTEAGLADAINDGGGRYESARNKMFALDYATQVQQMKAIGGQPDYALGSVHAVTRDGTLVIASASGSQLASYAWGAANVSSSSVRKARAHPGSGARADLSAQPAAGRRPRAGRLRSAQPGREDPGDPPGTARPHPHRPHPPAGRLLNHRAGRIRPRHAEVARDSQRNAGRPFINGVVHRGGSSPPALLAALAP